MIMRRRRRGMEPLCTVLLGVGCYGFATALARLAAFTNAIRAAAPGNFVVRSAACLRQLSGNSVGRVVSRLTVESRCGAVAVGLTICPAATSLSARRALS